MSKTLLVDKDKFIEYKAKAELYDNYLKEASAVFDCRNGGILRDFTNFIETLKEAKKGKTCLWFGIHNSCIAMMPYDDYQYICEQIKKMEDTSND